VLPEAIDLQGMSCDRARYREATDLLSEAWPVVAFTRGRDLPKDVRPVSAPPDAPTWEFFAVDCPEPDNEAHCEVRPRRTGRTQTDTDAALKKRPQILREELKHIMARRLQLLAESWRP
jgi:hypothetical protein